MSHKPLPKDHDVLLLMLETVDGYLQHEDRTKMQWMRNVVAQKEALEHHDLIAMEANFRSAQEIRTVSGPSPTLLADYIDDDAINPALTRIRDLRKELMVLKAEASEARDRSEIIATYFSLLDEVVKAKHASLEPFRQLRRRVIAAIEEADPLESQGGEPPKDPPKNKLMELADGGFTLRGEFHELTGRPLQMLKVLLASRRQIATADTLRKEMKLNDETTDSPEQVIKDTAKFLRAKLRRALQVDRKVDPLPSSGRGTDLTYHLSI